MADLVENNELDEVGGGTRPEAKPAAVGPSRHSFFSRRAALKSPNEALQPETAPAPPEQAKRKKKRRDGTFSTLSSILTFSAVLGLIGAFSFVLMTQKLKTAGPLRSDKIVILEKNGDKSIGERLEEAGVIDLAWLFEFESFVSGKRSKFKAGEYQFHAGESMSDVLDTIASGKQVPHPVTIPEGFTSEMVVNRLKEQIPALVGSIKDIPSEGSLLPQTYNYYYGDSYDKTLAMMRDAQSKTLAEIWTKRSPELILKSPTELLILASIVEKETGKPEERPHIAAVFLNRLQRGMRLQSDPTVIYGIVGGKGRLGHPITRAELDQPSQYNTYQIRGLPRGPIDNPGQAALEAVANPAHSSDLYFVADGTGGHAFAATLEGHNRNVARWRQIEPNAEEHLSPDLDRVVQAAKPEQHSESELPADNETKNVLSFDLDALKQRSNNPSADTLARAMAAKFSNNSSAAYMNNAATLARTTKVVYVPPRAAKAEKNVDLATFNLGPSLSDRGIHIAGVNDEADLSKFVDAPNTGDNANTTPNTTPNTTMETFPLPANRLADLRARQARYGLPTSSEVAPASVTDNNSETRKEDNTLIAYGAEPTKRRAFDASEGKSYDPLKLKNFDLSSAKTIPAGF